MTAQRSSMYGIVYSGMLLLFAGCFQSGGLPGETGTLHGTVYYHGKPIPTGSVVQMTHKERGILVAGITNSSGAFVAKTRRKPQLLVGEYQVHITPPGELNADIGTLTMDNVPDAWKKIPMKYWSSETSPESFVVHSGSNTYNLVLED